MIDIIFYLAVGGIGFYLYMLVRINIVYVARKKAIDLAYSHEQWNEYVDGPTWDEMQNAHTKWTFKHFYPRLAKLEEE